MKDFDVNELARMIADDLEEALGVRGRKTVPRQTNVPDGTNPSCQTNVASGASEGVGKPQGDDEWLPLCGRPIYNPLKGCFMATPKIGDKVYMVVPTIEGFRVETDKFDGTQMELLLLAQERLFPYKEDAERYKLKCEAIIAALMGQLAD